MMELLQLKYFCDAAETENYSVTAKKFLVPTSNISQSIKRLEKELGKELFEHRTNKIILADEGKRFYDKINKALLLIEDAKCEILDTEDEIFGEIKLFIFCNRSVVTEAIEKFKEDYPKVSFILRHEKDATVECDALISDSCPADFIPDELLIDEEIMLAVNRSHPLAAKSFITYDDIKNERFISMLKGASLYSVTSEIFKSFGSAPNITIETDDPNYVRKYIELGLGIAFIPSYSWSGLLSDNVILKSIGNHRRKTFIYLPKNRRTKRATEEFLKYLKSTIKF